MDDVQPLHPNLQRIAAAYRKLHLRWAAGELEAAEARQRIAALVARDDQGVQWRIDPNSGDWERQTHEGSWERAHPPTFGIATLSASDVSATDTDTDVADDDVTSFVVDEEALLPPGDVAGSTRRAQLNADAQASEDEQRQMSWLIPALALAVIVLLVALLLF